MIVVTGGAGFIGSNIVKGLNKAGRDDVFVVDDLTDGKKIKNLVECRLLDYRDQQDFLMNLLEDHSFEEPIDAIFYEGACSETTEWNGHYMMQNNYEYSKQLLHYCVNRHIPFIYASSAAVYGAGKQFSVGDDNEKPLNVYGYSKWLLDQYVLRQSATFDSPVVGLRYFNVYGPQESHKGKMASVAFHLMHQLCDTGRVKLFEGCDGYDNSEQRRDFVYVDDVVNVNLWLLDNPHIAGIFNVGTGESRSFNAIAQTLIAEHGSGILEYIPFPDHLKGAYQSFTEADMSGLRNAGYREAFCSLEVGLKAYYHWFK